MLMETLLFVAGSIGLAHILVDGKICKPFRDWLDEPPAWLRWGLQGWFIKKTSEMIHCHQCAGLWAGLVVGWLSFSSLSLWQWFACGFAGSFLSMYTAIYYNYLEAQTIMKLPPDEPSNPAPPPPT